MHDISDLKKYTKIFTHNLSTVKPNRCTIFRVYWALLYMFWTVFLSIIRSPTLYIQRQVCVILKFRFV